MEPLVSETLSANIVGVFGARGAAWLTSLPALLRTLEWEWQIKVDAPFPMLTFNYVAPATTDTGERVVLKTGPPCAELQAEMRALRLYDGRGAVRLLRRMWRHGAMLLERVEPGTMLSEITDDEVATRIAASCMRVLWTPLPEGHDFPTTQRWAEGLARLRDRFDGGTGPLPAHAVEKAERLFAQLFASATETTLLHGDLHHYNILRDGDGWRVIDPKGVAGEPAYECGAWLRNPGDLLERPNAGDLLARRIAIFSEMLGFDRERIRAWAYAQAVLSAWWCIEDGGDGWQSGMAVVELLDHD